MSEHTVIANDVKKMVLDGQAYDHVYVIKAAELAYFERPMSGDKFGFIQDNITANSNSGLPVFPIERKERKGRIAIVGFGPSLQWSWEGLQGYDVIWTVSKAHDFLISKGITPTHHTDVDYRDYKARMTTKWNDTTQYIIATQVHPLYLELAKGRNIQLFHTSVNLEGGQQYVYPPPYICVNSMWDAGQQAAYIAYLSGYTQQDWFGVDYSNIWQKKIQTDKHAVQSHAGDHEGVRSNVQYVLANNKIYETSTAHLIACLTIETVFSQHPDWDVQIYSDALLLNFLEERRALGIYNALTPPPEQLLKEAEHERNNEGSDRS